MGPHRSRRRPVPLARPWLPALLLLAVTTVGCDEDAPTLLAGGEIAAANGNSGGESLVVTVLAPDETPVPGRTVVVVSPTTGPYRADGSLAAAVTGPDGAAVVAGLERTDVCTYTTPVRLDDLSPAEGEPPVLPPADPDLVPASDASELGTALSGEKVGRDVVSVPLNLANWTAYCLEAPPITVRGNTSVTLVLQQPSSSITGFFLSLNGAQLEVPAYLLVDLTGLVPWPLPASSVADVKPGLFVAVDPAGQFDLPTPGGPVAVESQLVPLGGGFQTASTRLGDGDLSAGALPLGAEFCRVNEFPEPAGDGGSVDLVGPYRHGFLADELLDPVTSALSVSYVHVGEGSASFKLRERTGGTDQFKAGYDCTAAGCTVGKVVGSLLSQPGFDYGFSARPLTTPAGEPPRFVISWTVSGLPASDVETSVDTNGDQIPDASKSVVSSAFVPTPVPTSCVSEESRFILGG